jgi:hypothetical protein
VQHPSISARSERLYWLRHAVSELRYVRTGRGNRWDQQAALRRYHRILNDRAGFTPATARDNWLGLRLIRRSAEARAGARA